MAIDGGEKALARPLAAPISRARNPSPPSTPAAAPLRRALSCAPRRPRPRDPSALFEPARPAARAAVGAADPAPQLRHLMPGDQRRKSRIRRIEQMMAFVEHVTHAAFRRRVVGFIAREPILRRLRDDEGVIGDDDRRLARAANRALDETVR